MNAPQSSVLLTFSIAKTNVMAVSRVESADQIGIVQRAIDPLETENRNVRLFSALQRLNACVELVYD